MTEGMNVDRSTSGILLRNAGGFQVEVEDSQQAGRHVEQPCAGRQTVDFLLAILPAGLAVGFAGSVRFLNLLP